MICKQVKSLKIGTLKFENLCNQRIKFEWDFTSVKLFDLIIKSMGMGNLSLFSLLNFKKDIKKSNMITDSLTPTLFSNLYIFRKRKFINDMNFNGQIDVKMSNRIELNYIAVSRLLKFRKRYLHILHVLQTYVLFKYVMLCSLVF